MPIVLTRSYPYSVLALFGEQFATQFLSQSITWVDHLIFAVVPLGIITAVSGAIRVAGPRLAKSFIGRARENRASTEIELMSSISNEVGEMFNGNSIVRVIGRPEIAHFLLFPKPSQPVDQSLGAHNPSNPRENARYTYDIHTIGTAHKDELISSTRKSLKDRLCKDIN